MSAMTLLLGVAIFFGVIVAGFLAFLAANIIIAAVESTRDYIKK